MATAKETHAEKPKRAAKKQKFIVTRGKRKEAIARASIKPGSGKISVNGLSLDALNSPFVRQVISEPMKFYDASNTLDIDINVRGGGVMGQAQAARTAIARALVSYSKSDELKAEMLSYDRSLLVEDPRRVEPKKFKGPKARARFTKSYR
ncbi:MAG: 30S ribosomal protein S9 [Candidatus Micrarchaeia archaeon]|jgi:small subunit ribosomal protein S9